MGIGQEIYKCFHSGSFKRGWVSSPILNGNINAVFWRKTQLFFDIVIAQVVGGNYLGKNDTAYAFIFGYFL